MCAIPINTVPAHCFRRSQINLGLCGRGVTLSKKLLGGTDICLQDHALLLITTSPQEKFSPSSFCKQRCPALTLTSAPASRLITRPPTIFVPCPPLVTAPLSWDLSPHNYFFTRHDDELAASGSHQCSLLTAQHENTGKGRGAQLMRDQSADGQLAGGGGRDSVELLLNQPLTLLFPSL